MNVLGKLSSGYRKFGLRKNEKEHQVLNKASDTATAKGKTN
jgi:hypothetical protein